MSEITREELNAFTTAHEKTATVLEKIAGQLEHIAVKTDKLLEKIDNGISQTIIDGVVENYNTTHKETIDALNRIEITNKEVKDKFPVEVAEKINNSDIAKDIQHTKWFIGIVGIVVIVAVVILRGLEMHDIKNQSNANEATLQHLLEEYMKHGGEKLEQK